MVSSEMAKVEYADAIKTVSGALTKINKKSPHAADQKMVLATHRVAPTTSPDCSRLYIRGLSAVSRSSQPTSKELAVRARFTAVAAAIKTRKADLMRVTEDEAAFMAQKDLAGGKKTLKAWYWMVEGQAYDQEKEKKKGGRL